MAKRIVSKLEIDVFEFDEQYHAVVTHFGKVLHTTEGYSEHESAKWSAIDWINNNLKVPDNG